MHGKNGLPPTLNVHLLVTYVMPVLTYGLEVLLPSERELKVATQFHENTLRQLLSLPTRCAKPAMYVLSGQIPLVGQVHKKALTFLGNVLRQPDTIEAKIAARQFFMKTSKDKSWFVKLRGILVQYNLPHPLELLQSLPGKKEWARLTTDQVNSYWRKEILSQAAFLPSLCFLNCDLYTPGKCHPVTQSVTSSPDDSRRFGNQVWFMTGTVILQAQI